ncbi:MAG: LptE family protein [Verrucomicrobia bacterium]|nr:LptE family protein [Verrucomicrobiota bacterium]
MNSPQKKLGWLSLCLLACLLASGCAGYRLGSTGGFPAGSRSIQITPFPNQTTEPGLTEALSAAIRKEIQRDGTLALETRDRGDILLQGTIQTYLRDGVTLQPQDILTVRDFQVSVVAQVKALDRNSGKWILDRNVTGRTLVRGQTDLTEAERIALPLLMEDLARNITDLLVNGEF